MKFNPTLVLFVPLPYSHSADSFICFPLKEPDFFIMAWLACLISMLELRRRGSTAFTLLRKNPSVRGTPGGGGGTSYVLDIRYMCRARDPPFSTLHFRSGAYHFHKWQNISFQSITILVARQILHFLPFRRPLFSKLLSVQAVHRRPRPARRVHPSSMGKFQRTLLSQQWQFQSVQ